MTMTVVSEDGTVTLTDAVLGQIVVQAAEGVEGVRVRRRRHVALEIADAGTRVGLELTVAYGRVRRRHARRPARRSARARRR
jgi:uncharacterized alkaline shock family protein YloU